MTKRLCTTAAAKNDGAVSDSANKLWSLLPLIRLLLQHCYLLLQAFKRGSLARQKCLSKATFLLKSGGVKI